MAKVPDGAAVPVAGPVSDQPQRVDQMALYLHVPFCSVRCGYCDFNTYTAEELARDGVTISRERYVDQALLELAAARTALGDGEIRVGSIFVGGGTPTLLEPRELGRFFSAASEYFSLDADAEITVEANPDTLDEKYLAQLREAGATRLSMGMQSAVPHVLDTLERTHRPENVERSVRAAQLAGFEHVSVDLIYGTPGESLADWQQTLEAAADLAVDHISAYALIVEEGTKLAQQVHRGELQMPDDDQTAEKYLMADAAFTDLGMQWYEVSNWAHLGGECRHNLAYWRSENWWGVGPGAHSHVNGVRWWNVKHPAAYAARLAQGLSPAAAREVLTPVDQQVERLLLGIRLRDGLPIEFLDKRQQEMIAGQISSGLLVPCGSSVQLTSKGRLLADAVVRDLLD